METLMSFLYILAGLLVRLAIPIAGTLVLIVVLRRLDARWQAEAEKQIAFAGKPECSKIMGCSPDKMEQCATHESEIPCWQVNRLPNGYLKEECLDCPVFVEAPVPTLQVEPRRL